MRKLLVCVFLFYPAFIFAQTRYEDALTKADILYTESEHGIADLEVNGEGLDTPSHFYFFNHILTQVSANAKFKAIEIYNKYLNKSYYLDWDEAPIILSALKYFKEHSGIHAYIVTRNKMLAFSSSSLSVRVEINCSGHIFTANADDLISVFECAMNGSVFNSLSQTNRKTKAPAPPAPSVDKLLEMIRGSD